LKEFIASYYQQVFSAVVRLARLGDEKEVDMLAREILTDLWERRVQLDAEPRKGVFIYRVVLGHVFAHLKARGEFEKIEFLQKILLIHPAHYQLPGANEDPLQDASMQGDVGM
jgi:pantothenate kinase